MPAHDIDARRIAMAGGAIGLVIVLVVATAFALLKLWHMPARIDRVRLPYQQLIETPPLESAPQLDLARSRAEQQRLLQGSGWVDSRQGIVHIPIATAMQLLAQPATTGASSPEPP